MEIDCQLITQDEAAQIARCTVRHLQMLRKSENPPPVVRLGIRGIRYDRSMFVAWLHAMGEVRPVAAGSGKQGAAGEGTAP
jgi:hypothetical protein